MIKGILFDLDNTLVESTESIWRCADYVLRAKGLSGIDRWTAENAMRLKSDLFTAAEPCLGEAQKRMLFEEYVKCYKNFLRYTKILPYAHETLEVVKFNGLRLALVTTESRCRAIEILRNFGLLKFFEAIIGFEDTEQHKPSAQPVLKAISLLNLMPSEVLVVGDTELDVVAGKSAGAKTVAVLTGLTPIERVRLEKPDFIINGLHELPRIIDSLPK